MASGSSHPPPQGPALLAQGLGFACAFLPERRKPSPRGWHGQTAEAAAALRRVPRPAPIANAAAFGAAFGRPGADDGARAAVLQHSRRVHHEATERHAPRLRRRHPAGGRVDACAARGVGGVLAGRARCREHGPVWPASAAQPADWPRLAEAPGSLTRRCWPISSQSSGAAGRRLRRAS